MSVRNPKPRFWGLKTTKTYTFSNLNLLQNSNCIIYDSNNIFTILWFKIGQNIWDQLSFETNTDTNILVPEIGEESHHQKNMYSALCDPDISIRKSIHTNFPSNVTWSSYTLKSPHPHFQPFILSFNLPARFISVNYFIL